MISMLAVEQSPSSLWLLLYLYLRIMESVELSLRIGFGAMTFYCDYSNSILNSLFPGVTPVIYFHTQIIIN